MKTPIDRLKKKYDSHHAHLSAIVDAIMQQFNIPTDQRVQVAKAIDAAFDVGHGTTTTDDWCNSF